MSFVYSVVTKFSKIGCYLSGDVHIHIATQNVIVMFLFRPTHPPLKTLW